AAAAGDERSCATGTATYVSLEPPRLATPLAPASRTRRLAEASGEFSVSILSEAQAELAVRAASSADCEVPVDGCVAVYWCELESADGPLLVGRIRDAVTAELAPLLR